MATSHVKRIDAVMRPTYWIWSKSLEYYRLEICPIFTKIGSDLQTKPHKSFLKPSITANWNWRLYRQTGSEVISQQLFDVLTAFDHWGTLQKGKKNYECVGHIVVSGHFFDGAQRWDMTTCLCGHQVDLIKILKLSVESSPNLARMIFRQNIMQAIRRI